MDKTEKIVTNALEARAISEAGQKANFDKAMNSISYAARDGATEVVLYATWLSFEGVKQLMEKGFSVTEIMHPMELRKVQKVSW